MWKDQKLVSGNDVIKKMIVFAHIYDNALNHLY